MAWRYLAQRTRTGEWLHLDLPLSNVQITDKLSGPPELSASVAPEVPSLIGDDGLPILDEMGTTIYAEADGQLRFGGILMHSSYSDEGAWELECVGFSTVPHNIPYLEKYKRDSVDPLDVVRELWRHVQEFDPRGNLGVVVDSTTSPVRIGKNHKHVPLTTDSAPDEDAKPYELVPYDLVNCGAEIDELAKQTPFDYLEEHRWDGDSQNVVHRIRLGYPRVGRRRDDLRFVLGENLAVLPSPEIQGDDYVNEVYGVGKGEGSKALRAREIIDDGRIRRVFTFSNSGIGSKDRLSRLAREALAVRNEMVQLADVQITDHPNARLGSWSVGDDILVEGDIPWRGDFRIWCRIVSATYSPEESGLATLELVRSDSFTYGEITT